MSVQTLAFYRNGNHLLPNAHNLLDVKRKIIEKIPLDQLVETYLHRHPGKNEAIQTHKHKKMGKVGVLTTKLGENLSSQVRTAALIADGWLNTFIPKEALQPLSTVGLAIDSGFNKGIEKVFGGDKADREFIDRWINLSLAKSLLSFYVSKLSLDAMKGVSQEIRDFLERAQLETPFDPVELPNGTRIDRTVALEQRNEARERIDNHSLRLEAIRTEMDEINQRHLNPEQEERVADLAEEVNWIEGQLKKIMNNFYEESDLKERDIDFDQITTFLNAILERSKARLEEASPLQFILAMVDERQRIDQPKVRPLTNNQSLAAKQFLLAYRREMKRLLEDRGFELLREGVEMNVVQSFLDDLEGSCDRALLEALQIPEELEGRVFDIIT